MIRTLAGENWFALQEALRQLRVNFVRDHGDMAVEQLDGDTAEFGHINEALQSAPFLVNKKLVVLRNPSSNKQFIENIEKLLASINETTDVVIVEQKIDNRLNYYKYLKRHTDFKEFPQLEPPALARWLVGSAKEQGGKLSHGDAVYLVDRVGTNQQVLASELGKLLLYQPSITGETIDLLTDRTEQGTIFELLDAAFAGNKQRAIQLYEEQRAQKVDPLAIIAMLSWQLHVLALLVMAGGRSADRLAADAKLNPYTVRKSQAVARKLQAADIRRYVRDLLAIDKRARRESIDLDEALQLYLLQLG